MNKSQFVLNWPFKVVLNIFKTQWDGSYEVEETFVKTTFISN